MTTQAREVVQIRLKIGVKHAIELIKNHLGESRGRAWVRTNLNLQLEDGSRPFVWSDDLLNYFRSRTGKEYTV